jgi:glycosyltransferase involved in cell wall biosynthesis
VGFAQPWIIYPDNEIYHNMPFLLRVKTRIEYIAKAIGFKLADSLVVELDHVKNQLRVRKIFDSERIDTVHNCLSSVYLHPQRWQPLNDELNKSRFSIGFVGRDYVHKNTKILPEIRRILSNKHGLAVDFYVTFSPEEWRLKEELFRSEVCNVGVLNVAQCPSFYEKMDAIIFPSLLECFSSTPLEAMAMGKPLFASDRNFVQDVCGNFCYYFDPEDPASAADLIANYILNIAGRDSSKLAKARIHVLGFSSPHERAERYLEILRSSF